VIGVNNINFSIGPGVTGFLGPNGAGKTTMIRLLTGQLKPSKGVALIAGEKIWNNHEIVRSIGYCPEADAFWSFLTGKEFVESMLRLHDFNEKEAGERAARSLELTNLQEAQNRKIGSYSKGMRQRIKLAQALAHDPDLLFLDEPLNGMDPLGRKQLIDLIRSLGKQGKTVVVSSHVLHEVEEMTDNILLLNHGRLLAEGNIYDIRKLIDTHPLQISIECDNAALLAAVLTEYEDIIGIKIDRVRNRLTVETRDPDLFHSRLPGLALKKEIKIYSLWSPDENLEAVFGYLVR